METARSVLAIGIMVVISTVAPDGAAAEEIANSRGAAALVPFKQNLMAALRAGLEEGPENAISVCKEQAPAIAGELSSDGVLVGRTSHRLRNPANTAPDWVSPVLRAYVTAVWNPAPVTVSLPGNRTGYVEPIVTQPLCLTCHGEVLEPGLAARIERDYPHDRATGFRVGDLRGVFWAEFPADD